MPRAKKAALVEELEKEEKVENTTQPDVEVVTTIEEDNNFSMQRYTKDGEKVSDNAEKYGRVNCDFLNVRSEASITASVISLLTKGVVVGITGEEVNGFYPIVDSRDPVFKVNGFVKKEFLDL